MLTYKNHVKNTYLDFYLSSYEKGKAIIKDNYIVRYNKFDIKNKIFKNVTSIHVNTGDVLIKDTASFVSVKEKHYFFMLNPYSMIQKKAVPSIKLLLVDEEGRNQFFETVLDTFYTLKNEKVFYNRFFIQDSAKKNVWFYVNIFLISTGISAVFLIFALFFSIQGYKIVNLSISFSIIPVVYIVLFYLSKIPYAKISFLNRGILTYLKIGIPMFVICLLLITIAIVKIKLNSKKEV